MSEVTRKDEPGKQPEFSVEKPMMDPVAAPPLSSVSRPEGGETAFVAEALEAVEQDTPAPPGRDKVSQAYWSLVWWKFKKNKLAIIGAFIAVAFYLICVFFPEFFAPYLKERESDLLEARPTLPHFFDETGAFHLRPFVYG